MRKIVLKCLSIVSLLLCVCEIYAQKSEARLAYIEEYKDIAIAKMKSHGIPASITLAQGCLESGDGKSDLATKANNHFGIKCHKGWDGPTYYKKDDDPGESCFRKYKKAEDSYKDHSDFLRYRDRYAFLFDLDVTDYKGWAHGLKKAGHATNPKYAQLLIDIIEEYELYKYDRGEENMVSKANKSPLPPSPTQLEAIKQYQPEKNSVWYKYSQNRTLYSKNGVTYILSNEGDTYESIAQEYNLFKKEILKFNDLMKDQELKMGTVVYLEKKKKKALKHLDIHIAEPGDNYYDLSQRYAVRLDYLLDYNGAAYVDDIIAGEEIYLRKFKK